MNACTLYDFPKMFAVVGVWIGFWSLASAIAWLNNGHTSGACFSNGDSVARMSPPCSLVGRCVLNGSFVAVIPSDPF